jgi:hypothetical protein
MASLLMGLSEINADGFLFSMYMMPSISKMFLIQFQDPHLAIKHVKKIVKGDFLRTFLKIRGQFNTQFWIPVPNTYPNPATQVNSYDQCWGSGSACL